MNVIKNYKSLCFAILFLLQACAGSPKITTAVEESHLQKNVIGKWAMLIQTDGELSSNKIYLQLNFRSDGIVEYKGDGILYSGEKAAIFTMMEIKKWHISNNYIYEKQIGCSLPRNIGDKDLKMKVRNLFDNFKKDRESGNWEWGIVNITCDSLILQARDGNGNVSLLTYYRIE